MVNLALAWAEEYQKTDPMVSISVTGGGSGTGIAALVNNTVDIANASRPIKTEEIEQMQAKREQLEMMVEWREEAQKLQESQVAIVAQYWKHSTMGDPYNCCDLVHLKHLVTRFGPHVVCDGIDRFIFFWKMLDQKISVI